jgi:Na+/proline symporter
MDLKTCLYVGFALYTVFVIYVGFIGSKKIKGLSDFAVASESMGPISLGLAFAASFFSAATFLAMSVMLMPGELRHYGYF